MNGRGLTQDVIVERKLGCKQQKQAVKIHTYHLTLSIAVNAVQIKFQQIVNPSHQSIRCTSMNGMMDTTKQTSGYAERG